VIAPHRQGKPDNTHQQEIDETAEDDNSDDEDTEGDTSESDNWQEMLSRAQQSNRGMGRTTEAHSRVYLGIQDSDEDGEEEELQGGGGNVGEQVHEGGGEEKGSHYPARGIMVITKD